MKLVESVAGTVGPDLLASLVGAFVPGCGKSVSDGGSCSNAPTAISGTYASVDRDATIEFNSGVAVVSMDGERGAPGTDTVDGEKIIVNMRDQTITFRRDGACIDDYQRLLGNS